MKRAVAASSARPKVRRPSAEHTDAGVSLATVSLARVSWATLSAARRSAARSRAMGLLAVVILAIPMGARGAQVSGVPPVVGSDTTAILLDPLLVQTARPAVTPGGASAIVARPETLPLAPAPSLEDVLRTLPMVQIRRNSRGEAQMSLRGSRERSMAVLLDGIPVSLGWDHRADLSVIPVSGAREITLIRGMNSLLHGPNVLGGVVKVDLARVRMGSVSPLQEPTNTEPYLSFGLDQGGGVNGQALAAHRIDGGLPMLFRIGIAGRDRRELPLPGDLSSTYDRDGFENSDLREASAFVAFRAETDGGGWVSLSSSATSTARGVVSELGVDSPRFFRQPDARRLITALSVGHSWTPYAGRRGGVEGALGADLGAGNLISYRTRGYDQVSGEEEGDDRVLSGRVTVRQQLGGGFEFALATTVADVHRRETVRPAETTFTYRQTLGSVATELTREGTILGLPWVAVGGGVALDGAETLDAGPFSGVEGTMSAWGARFGFSALIGGDQGARIHGSVGHRGRFPSLREMYSGALGRFEPNPALRPERLTGAELGLTTRPGGGELQFVAFDQRLADAVVRVGLGGGQFRRENREQVRATGLETMGVWEQGPILIAADLTLQRVRLVDPLATGTPPKAEYQPEVSGRVQVGLALPGAVQSTLSIRGVGSQWCTDSDQGQPVRLGGSTSTDLQTTRSWSLPGSWAFGGRAPRVGLTAAVDNLLDSTAWDQCGLPQPGRLMRFQLRIGG
jgi:iron complex outermembrane receptor protein